MTDATSSIDLAFAKADGDTCPVSPLGHNSGQLFFLDAADQMRSIPIGRLSRNEILGLFGNRSGWLWDSFPTTGDDGKTNGFRINTATQWLINRCFDAGVFDPTGLVRGTGMWEADPASPLSGLIVHAGDEVMVAGEWVLIEGQPVRESAPEIDALGQAQALRLWERMGLSAGAPG